MKKNLLCLLLCTCLFNVKANDLHEAVTFDNVAAINNHSGVIKTLLDFKADSKISNKQG